VKKLIFVDSFFQLDYTGM